MVVCHLSDPTVGVAPDTKQDVAIGQYGPCGHRRRRRTRRPRPAVPGERVACAGLVNMDGGVAVDEDLLGQV